MAKNSVHVVGVVFLLLVGVATVCHGLQQTIKNRVDELVNDVMRCGQIPSLSLAMVGLEKKTDIYVKGYGIRDLVSQKKTNSATKFCLGTGTQAFTAVLLAKLMDEAENRTVTWSTPIQEILQRRLVLPDLYRSRNIDLLDIFSHRSGLGDMTIVTLIKPYDVKTLLRNLKYLPEEAGFREKYVPNEVLFSLVGQVVEELGGDTWQNLLKQHILEPLGITDAIFLDGSDLRGDNMANPTVKHNNKPFANGYTTLSGQELVESSSGLCLSADDMSKWIRFVLLKGVSSDNSLLVREELIEETFRGVQSRGHGDPITEGYRQSDLQRPYFWNSNALGWISGSYVGFRFISQHGYLPGYQSLTTIIPNRKVAAFAAFSGPPGPKAFAAKIILNIVALDTLMHANPWRHYDDICKVMDTLENAFESTSLDSDVHRVQENEENKDPLMYTGTFRSYPFGDVSVSYNKSEEYFEELTMEYGLAEFILEPTDVANVFRVFAEDTMWYLTGADGYKERPVLAKFIAMQEDDQEKIESVHVVGLEEGTEIVFSRNPVRPEVETESSEPNGGSKPSALSLLSLFVLTIINYFR